MPTRPAPAELPQPSRGVRRHVVVDGSNIATEGRETPSLAQLDEAVQAYMREYGPEIVTVVVDATFPNRIAREERRIYEAAAVAGEIITPPAGAIGRGDAFILQIADRADATILSNDSFQEFHGHYDWLFDPGRLVGGKPVPHVGWVFMDRTPVRGPLSRRSVSAAKRSSTSGPDAPPAKARRATKASKAAAAKDGGAAKTGRAAKTTKATRGSRAAETVDATATATADAPVAAESGRAAGAARGSRAAKASDAGLVGGPVGDDGASARQARLAKSGRAAKAVSGDPAPAKAAPAKRVTTSQGPANTPAVGSPAPANDALPFIEFVGAHPVGSLVEAVVEQFSSHGAYARVGPVQTYLPLKYLADPAPRSAKKILRVGETREFVVVAVDPARRGIDLALPGVELPVEDAVAPGAAASAPAPAPAPAPEPPAGRGRRGGAKATKAGTAAKAAKAAEPKKAEPRKAPAKKAAAAKKATPAKAAGKATKATKKKQAGAQKSASGKAAPAKKPAAKKAAAAKPSVG